MPVLSNRNTTVTINDTRTQPLQPWLGFEKQADMIALGGHEDTVDAVNVGSAGWQIAAFNDDVQALFEDLRGLAGIIRLSAGTAATGVGAALSEFATQRQNTGTGITYDGDTGDNDSFVFQKFIEAAASWALTLSGDLASWPVPDSADQRTDVDRLFITTANHLPDQTLYFQLTFDTAPYGAYDVVAGLTFSGPAGKDDGGTGTGVYYLKFLGTGAAVLYEADISSFTSTSATWIRRYSFKWTDPGKLVGVHRIRIQTNAWFDNIKSKWVGDAIMFHSQGDVQLSSAERAATGGPFANWTFNWSLDRADYQSSQIAKTRKLDHDGVYQVPGAGKASTFVTTNRIDVRRDIRPTVQLAKAKYPTTATVRDDTVSLSFFPTADNKLVLEWYANKPSGTTVDGKLFDAETDVELSNPTTTIDDRFGGQKEYDSPDRKRKFYAKFTLTGDGDNTPSLRLLRVFRDPLNEEPARTTVVAPKRTNQLAEIDVRSVTVTGTGQDPSSGNAVVEFWDYTDELSTLRNQTVQPVTIETEYDAVPNKTILFQGYVKESRYRRRGQDLADPPPSAQPYPDMMHGSHSMTVQGEWLRLTEALAPQRYAWYDQAEGAPQKIDVVIETLLKAAGYDASQIETPGSELRLWGEDDTNWMTDVSTPIADFIQGLVQNFYGGHMIYDPNAGAKGMWRVFAQKSAPYNILARFETQDPATVKTRLTGPHADIIVAGVSEAYGTTAAVSPEGNAQTIEHTFIQRGTLVEWPEKPEGNLVYVRGMSGVRSGTSNTKLPRPYDALLVNPDSYNPFNLAEIHANYPDVTGPDYIGHMVPIHAYDFRLPTQEAVNFVARRIFDYACHGRRHMQFTAPIILVTDADDANQVNPRPLRYYDVVEVWSDELSAYEEFLVESANIQYTHDDVQLAVYHLVRSSVMAVKAPMTNSWASRAFSLTKTVALRKEGRVIQQHFDPSYIARMGLSGQDNASDVIQLPNPFDDISDPPGDPLQQTDPSDPDFGDFAFVHGIDPIG